MQEEEEKRMQTEKRSQKTDGRGNNRRRKRKRGKKGKWQQGGCKVEKDRECDDDKNVGDLRSTYGEDEDDMITMEKRKT